MKQIMRIAAACALSLCVNGFANAQDTTEGKSSTFVKPDKPENVDEWRTHLGVIGGYVENDGAYNPTVEYGLDMGWQPYIPFGIGVELTTASNDDLTRSKLLGRFTYNFGGSIALLNRSYIGGAIGPAWDSDSENEGIHLAYAPVLIGFDIPFKEVTEETLSLGMQAKYLVIEGDSPDSLIINGAMKYWF